MKRLIPALAVTLLVGAAPAMADEPTAPEPEPQTTESYGGPLAMLLADEFGMQESEVLALLDLGLGFGDIFKLKTLAQVMTIDVNELLAGATVDPETGEYEFDWDALKATLTEAQLALLAELPKNFGQVVSAHQRHHGRDAHQPDHAGKPARNGDDPSPSQGRGRGHGH